MVTDSMHVSAAAERQEVGTDDFLDGLLRESVSAVLSKVDRPMPCHLQPCQCVGASFCRRARRQTRPFGAIVPRRAAASLQSYNRADRASWNLYSTKPCRLYMAASLIPTTGPAIEPTRAPLS